MAIDITNRALISRIKAWPAAAAAAIRWHLSGIYYLPVTVPIVTTQPVTNISVSSCLGNGTIVNTGGTNAVRRGFCIKAGSVGTPSVADIVVAEAGSFITGAFSLNIPDLIAGSNYRLCAFAEQFSGISYGATAALLTKSYPLADPINICPACKSMFMEDSAMYEDTDMCPSCGMSLSTKSKGDKEQNNNTT